MVPRPTPSALSLLCLLLLAGLPSRDALGQSFLERLERKLDAGAGTRPGPPAGGVPRSETAESPAGSGYLGLLADDRAEGVVVLEVRPGSPAAESGVVVGDRLTEIDGRPIGSLEELGRVMANSRAGQRISLSMNRQGTPVKLVATLTQNDRKAVLAAAEPAASPKANLGITVRELTPDVRFELKTPVKAGVMIQSVRPGSPADRYGLRPGYVIVKLNNAAISSAAELAAVVAGQPVGAEIPISYYEGQSLVTHRIKLGAAQPAPLPPVGAPPRAPDDSPFRVESDATRQPAAPAAPQALPGLRLPVPPPPADPGPEALPAPGKPVPGKPVPGTTASDPGNNPLSPQAPSAAAGPPLRGPIPDPDAPPAVAEPAPREADMIRREIQQLEARLQQLRERLKALEP